MVDYWFDSDSFMRPNREAFRFGTDFGEKFWNLLSDKLQEGVIASSSTILDELLEGKDELSEWAKRHEDYFYVPDQSVQEVYTQIADSVHKTGRYSAPHIAAFLDNADPWIIAHAKVSGGRVVTFEKSEPSSSKPKIPDVAAVFELNCDNLWDILPILQSTNDIRFNETQKENSQQGYLF